ncbi:MAG: glycosyltransferase family 4 protein [Deltaproteobacteria bacterium]|nr:glycosyltransferase family 4 protein [Deltaproteobacteria bacterium]MBW2660393.1 glycosyltransferase family 4 protein [Deltaproteobacteria bacterium]
MGENIGFVSTRFAGTDGVTLESSKWAQVLKKSGRSCFWFAGELDRNPQNSLLVPEAFFKYKENNWINEQVVGKKGRSSDVTEAIHFLRSYLKAKLYEFIEKFQIDMLIAENALTIPMHVPLGLALTEIIAETQIPTIAHHHDFYWERIRFTVNAVNDYIQMAFPPALPNIEHVVINSAAKEELAHRTGISSTIIPNVLDFENPPFVNEKRTEDFRNSLGLKPDDVMILQPSRVIQRKGIEHAIELVHELKDPRYKLVISHETGDEGYEYAEWLIENAKDRGVDLRLFDAGMADPVNDGLKSPNQYSLWDIYPHADFITYPSLYEGFGNAFLEAIYFKKPMLVNRYATFVRDIEPKGFNLIVMDGFLTKKTVQKAREILESPEKKAKMVNHNYEIASRYYSYSVLRKGLSSLIINFFGIEE